jgi:hypothetical protein
MTPETQFAQNQEVTIAYQVFGFSLHILQWNSCFKLWVSMLIFCAALTAD